MNSHFHFLGICGTAMGAVAAAMARRGFTVTGSDANVYPPMSTFLEEEGITLFEGYKASNIPADADVIVIGNAMSRGNEEVEAVLQRRLRYLSLPETMKEYFLRGKRNYVVTGTHGKTTTTSRQLGSSALTSARPLRGMIWVRRRKLSLISSREL